MKINGVKLNLIEYFFGIKCPHCRKRGDMEFCSHTISPSFYCYGCAGVTWCESYEDFKAKYPDDIIVQDSEDSRFFPDFKFNSSVRK